MISWRIIKSLLYLTLVITLTSCLYTRETRVWTADGARYRRPSLSPDGKWLLFESKQHLHICRPDGSNRRCLSEDLENGSDARWSPDSRSIVFSGQEKGQRDVKHRDLFKTDPEGREVINLTNTPGTDEDFVEWSPDGSRIVFVRNVAAAKRSELVISAPDGSGQRFLVIGFIARWSPDGRWIAYDSRQRDLRVIRIDGSQDRKIVEGTPITWTPDSKAIFYAPRRSRADEPYHIYLVRFEGGEGSLVLENAWLDGNYDARRMWAPSGNCLALAVVPIVGRQDRNGIVLLSPQGKVLADYRESEPFDYDPGVSWSPDGNTLVFSKFLAYPKVRWQGGIYTMGAEGTNLRQVLEDTVQWRLQ